MTANFYRNNSDNKYVNKSLTILASNILIELKDDTDILNPTLILTYNSNFVNANYIYISDLQRYYFIDKIEYSQQMIYLICSCDLLMTYKDDILNLECVIKRQQNKYNSYLNDEKYKAYEYSRIQTIEFPNGFTTNAFILAIAGG